MGTALELRTAVTSVMSSSPDWNADLLTEIPVKWTIHGDCALLPSTSFISPVWDQYPEVYSQVASILKVNRVARQNGPIQNPEVGAPDYRQPSITLLLGSDPVVRKKENGIWYSWDITKVMFSAGNISEKQRLSRLHLSGQTVVDLYAGIGYFSLTFLVHAGAGFLYACEWNPAALHWLEVNLKNKQNKIDPSRYTILPGDNRVTAPKGVADRVNLGLIPSSEGAWEVAAAALKRDTGGILSIHGNVDIIDKEEGQGQEEDDHANVNGDRDLNPLQDIHPCWQRWSKHVESSIMQIFIKLYPDQTWSIRVTEVIKVKSYGPKVHHLVADVICKPLPPSN